jgi:SpoVK/Ycf46/Vps4 family AAA+-type ATPase
VVNRTLQQKSSGLEGMTQHIKSAATWADLGLPTEVVSKLKEVCSQVKQSSRTSIRESNPDKGLIVLFSGLGGTSKIKAAEVIANQLHLDLYRVDLSAILSKYIGETEKNLRRLFDTTEATNTILFFDEADALFDKRSEVRDAHDRYANIEVSYLLERIEDYKGIAILATNLRINIDEAFMRRMHCVVEFPPPNSEGREEVWRDVFLWLTRCLRLLRKRPPSKAQDSKQRDYIEKVVQALNEAIVAPG